MAKTRRDESKTHRERWKHDVEGCVQGQKYTTAGKPEVDGWTVGPTTWSSRPSGPRRRERARKSTLTGQSTLVATRDLLISVPNRVPPPPDYCLDKHIRITTPHQSSYSNAQHP